MSTRPVTRLERREDTRRRLLVVARELFASRGWEGTHLRDVAAAANVASGTIFVHFSDKRDLLPACLFDALEATIAAAIGWAPAGLEPWLVHLVDALFGYYEARPTLSRVLLRESLLAEP